MTATEERLTQILEGKTSAARIRGDAAARCAEVRRRLGRPPTLAAVAIDTGNPGTLFFDVKRQAFEDAGARFLPYILPAATTQDDLTAAIESLNADPEVDGIYVQYPLPDEINAQAAYDVIAPTKDVDGASSRQPDPPNFFPATAEAVVDLLTFHNIPLAGRTVAVVRGDPLFARLLTALFEREGAFGTVVTQGTDGLPVIEGADIVVVATGVVHGVEASVFRPGAVAVDVGYYHGGGRGDIAASPAEVARLSAYAPPRGAIGPLTVALLVAHTAEAAARTAARTAVAGSQR